MAWGGHAAGEVASALVARGFARTIQAKLLAPLIADSPAGEPDYAALVAEAGQTANRAVYEGSTMVAALVVEGTAYLANVGDSRAYLVTPREIRQLTTDHSLVERLIATGQITREEARSHPQRNVVYRTMGDKPQVEVEVVQHALRLGEAVLLCSDGLHGMVDESQIHQCVLRAPHPQAACEALIELANQAGGDDNVTAILIQLTAIGKTT